MRARLLRRPFSTRIVAIVLLVVGFGAYCYYYSSAAVPYRKSVNRLSNEEVVLKPAAELWAPDHTTRVAQPIRKLLIPKMNELQPRLREPLYTETGKIEQCQPLKESRADINTLDIYPTFEFQPSWLRTKEFWDKSFEDRYEKMYNDSRRPPLKVIVVPHSHNDPGWLKTFEQYFDWKTKNIINNMVLKLNQYPNMTFIWTEISYLEAWWERSHPVRQKALKKLIKEGRLEITTGGWVMPDEACTHIYALIDQFIEGHQWVKNKLGIAPKTGWSIDPFGHGPTVPYLLDKSGLEGAIIQRIHYAWKQWLARRQIEEFYWTPGWSEKKPSLVVHNQPFDIYSIKSTCGPHPSVCLGFDFRQIPGEYTEYTAKHEDITSQNVHSKSRTLIDEYHRIGSLTPHNVVLVPLGDDFRYEFGIEFDDQYINYMKMFNYINANKDKFNAEVQFGTPIDYFNAMKERHKNIPTLKGDFFVYSDIFSEGKPAYWSGYYTTRPYMKILARQFEHQLRTAEILFTLVYNSIKQSNNPSLKQSEIRLERSYEQLINARRNLGLFQHHDAITGTSRAIVMEDYGTKMFTSIYHCIRLQEAALAAVMIPDEHLHTQNVMQSDSEWETYGSPVKKLQVSLVDKKKIVLFNPLAEKRTEVITIQSNVSNVRVYDTYKKEYPLYQITPYIELKQDGRHIIKDNMFDVVFVATLAPLTAVTYLLEEHTNSSHHSQLFCKSCSASFKEGEKPEFQTKRLMPGDIQLENSVLKLLINRNTGFLRQIYRKDIRKKNVVEMQFGAYLSAQRHSGAYLFMPDYDSPEKRVLQYGEYENLPDDRIVISSGPISTEIISYHTPLLIHSIKIYSINDPFLSRAILVENIIDFGNPPMNRDTEMFMRIQTDILNGDVPEFYTDQNGFQYQKRVKIDKVGIEGNYYPITTMAWLQDEETRLTVLTNHAQGAASFEPGRIELMLDRRTLYDDFRGIGEGVVDNKRTLYQNWLLLEPTNVKPRNKRDTSENVRQFNQNDGSKDSLYAMPTQTADYLSRTINYPVNVYLIDTSEVGEVDLNTYKTFLGNFPEAVHLVTLRAITDEQLDAFPSSSAFMVLQRSGYSCSVGDTMSHRSSSFSSETGFQGVSVKNITAVSLTGLKTYKSLTGMNQIHLNPMEVKTFKIEF